MYHILISSPGYPKEYQGDRVCEYDIEAPLGKAIVLQISDIDIEEHLSCEFDYVEVRINYFHSNFLA